MAPDTYDSNGRAGNHSNKGPMRRVSGKKSILTQHAASQPVSVCPSQNGFHDNINRFVLRVIWPHNVRQTFENWNGCMEASSFSWTNTSAFSLPTVSGQHRTAVYLSGHRRDSCSSMIRDSYSMEQRYLRKPRRGWQPSATWYQTELCNWKVPDREDRAGSGFLLWFS